ncbi:UDP-glucuronosyl/UDP-glucosyltransferase family-containing protein [Strongyloides ratti]|uniref:glucuronosyltransferase n=1 Tax=Strongyloides ratti TaxID=34506 RepID=A0A090LSD5_STRRB|nr:UDP-glucuronosyl/UDP-glucosyltransferase family-containing protein [Strongyloides ratti]CEF71122.1 UDP-glucuronosyl/UDP-glucosyltransferase family-containing protein [Strongyloides ratti]
MLLYQLLFILFIFLISLFKIYANNLPLAPFQIKIQCKSGLSYGKNDSIKKKEICPVSSTSCAYIEIPLKKDNISIYECVDESILSGEDDGEEMAKHKLFSQMCNHIPKCQLLNSTLLNPSFKKYLSTTYKLISSIFLNKKLLFCCSMNSAVLEKIIKSKDKSQKLVSSNSIKCNKITCGNGAIGCLSYQQFPKAKIINAEDYIDDEKEDIYDSNENFINENNKNDKEMIEYSYEDDNINNNYNFEPIQIEFNTEFDQIYRKKRHKIKNQDNEKTYQCVYPHLNDEVYRYCTMIYSNLNNNRCYKGKEFKICCCYVRPNTNTCEPGEKELPPTIILPPRIVSNKNIIENKTIILKKNSQNKISTTTTIPTISSTIKSISLLERQNKSKITNFMKNKEKNILSGYKKSTNRKCKYLTKQKMRRLQNDRIIPYFYKQEICSSSPRMTRIFYTIYMFIILQEVILSEKILIYSPSYTASHTITNGKIADILVKNGHDVTLLILDFDSTVKINGTKLGKVVRMANLSQTYEKLMSDWLGGDGSEQPDIASFWSRYSFEKVSNDICKIIISRINELDFLKEEKFDLGFVEMIEYCGHGILHYLNIKKTIWISTTPLHDTVAWNFGLPTTPSYIPSVEENFNGPIMNFWERLINTKQLLTQLFLQYISSEMCTSNFRNGIDKNFPNLRYLASNSSIGFVMTDEILDVPRPILHKIIYIGGLGFENPKPLSTYWNNIMNMGKKGVILFSMGTGASFSLFEVKKKIDILNAFNEFSEYQFILKINKDDKETENLIKNYTNIVLTSWMPQPDLLNHPNMKLFITHGGIASIIESHMNGIPLIVIPSFADQQRNAKFIEWRGTGIAILRSTLNFEVLKNAINEILTNDNYRSKVNRIKKLIKTKPGTPEKKLVEWTNYVLVNDGLTEFNSPANEMNIFVYHGIDILLFIIFLFITLIYIFIKIFTLLIRIKKMETKTSKKSMLKKKKA